MAGFGGVVNDPLLIDECLSAELPAIAHELGFEAYHVARFGLAGAPDHAIFAKVAERGFTFVTNNRDDFVELAGRVDLHGGLIVLMSQGRRESQKAMLRAALLHVREIGGLINRVLEVQQDGQITVFELPASLPRGFEDIAPPTFFEPF
jgi:predicted nuclease of predicted toxin-antitoxin system